MSIIRIITVFIFRRLKINHESHEFILDPGTVGSSSRAPISMIGVVARVQI